MESVYSASSNNSRSRAIQRKIQNRSAGIITGSAGNTEIRQRVISARLQRLKNLQNQLNEALQANAVSSILSNHKIFICLRYSTPRI